MLLRTIRKYDLLKYILPILFIVYYSGTTLFYHTHTENGRSVSHSHPYTSGTPSNPQHSHAGGFVVSMTPDLTAPDLAPWSLSPDEFSLHDLLWDDRCTIGRTDSHRHYSRRAPPRKG